MIQTSNINQSNIDPATAARIYQQNLMNQAEQAYMSHVLTKFSEMQQKKGQHSYMGTGVINDFFEFH